MNDLYRLIYTSRDQIPGDSDERAREVDRIICVCRRNNRRDGITGALLLGEGAFAQVLEGTRASVEATFERIQCDVRHGDIDVLQCEPVADRMFSDWDMALVGGSEPGRLLLKDLSGDAPFQRFGIDGGSLCSAVLATVQAEAARAEAARAKAERAEARPPFPDPERLRSDLDALRRVGAAAGPGATAATAAGSVSAPAEPAPAPTVADVGDAVLRAALDEERARTTALRGELDDARVALARMGSEAEALGRHRDIWADRSRQMRSSLQHDRQALAAATEERDASRDRLAACEDELCRLRLQRDVWADCARALAAVLSASGLGGSGLGGSDARAAPREGAETPGRERAPLRTVSG